MITVPGTFHITLFPEFIFTTPGLLTPSTMTTHPLKSVPAREPKVNKVPPLVLSYDAADMLTVPVDGKESNPVTQIELPVTAVPTHS
jgi:hypothetical protein